MSELQKLNPEAVKEAISTTGGLVGKIYDRYVARYTLPEKYLAERIISGEFTEKDIETASLLYSIPQMRRKYRHIKSIVTYADSLVDKAAKQGKAVQENIEDDWFSYFIDKASLIGDESVQKVWSFILAQECIENGSFRKVMLDRLALLDRKSAESFGQLCTLTYSLSVSDDRDYSIPLYLRDDTISKILRKGATQIDTEVIEQYKKLLPNDEELEILQDIGLISLSENGDDSDIYSLNRVSFEINVGDRKTEKEGIYDKKQRIYFLPTGNATYTKMGLSLFKILEPQYPPKTEIIEVLKYYLKYYK